MKNGLVVSHLMFADDLLLFGEATENQMYSVSDILQRFCAVSGQQLSNEKTSILFSSNTARIMQD